MENATKLLGVMDEPTVLSPLVGYVFG